jgi:16S rRNA (cytosine967-C5)-methyltransferase
MTPPPRDRYLLAAAGAGRIRDAVLALVLEIDAQRTRPAADVVTAALRKHRALTSGERRFVSESVFGMIRQRRRVEEALRLAVAGGGGADTLRPSARGVARYLAYLVLAAGRRPEEAQAELKRSAHGASASMDFARLAEIDAPDVALAVRTSMPDWIAARACELLGADEGAALLAAQNQRAPLCIRANRLRGDRRELARRLAAEEVQTVDTRLAGEGLLCESRASLFTLASFVDGWFEVQDEGSQLVGESVAPPPGGFVIDACAGAGGKTLQLASLMGNRGRIVALDPVASRLEELKRRSRRAGLTNVQALAIARDGELQPEIRRFEGRADRVLVDAPCSGLGVLRRIPESRWRVTEDDVARLAGEQLAILTRFAPLCAVGGRLVYATCSFLREENEEVVTRFLLAHPAFEPVPLKEVLGREKAEQLGDGHTLRLYPHRQGTDAFYAAILRRRV